MRWSPQRLCRRLRRRPSLASSLHSTACVSWWLQRDISTAPADLRSTSSCTAESAYICDCAWQFVRTTWHMAGLSDAAASTTETDADAVSALTPMRHDSPGLGKERVCGCHCHNDKGILQAAQARCGQQHCTPHRLHRQRCQLAPLARQLALHSQLRERCLALSRPVCLALLRVFCRQQQAAAEKKPCQRTYLRDTAAQLGRILQASTDWGPVWQSI